MQISVHMRRFGRRAIANFCKMFLYSEARLPCRISCLKSAMRLPVLCVTARERERKRERRGVGGLLGKEEEGKPTVDSSSPSGMIQTHTVHADAEQHNEVKGGGNETVKLLCLPSLVITMCILAVLFC